MAWFHLHRHLQNAFVPHAGNNYHPQALHHHMLGAYAVILIALKIATVSFVSLSSPAARVSEVTPTNIVRLSNNERRTEKIPVLKSNALLSKAAQSKANDMLRLQYFAHVSPTNTTPWYWFKQAGYRYQYAGENLAIDFVESEDVVQAWMNSPAHRKNVLNAKFKEVGVAVVSGSFNGTNSVIVVQMFGTPPPQPVKKVAAGPVQQPTPVVVKQQLAQAAPTVLGESEEPAPVVSPEPTPAPEPPKAPVVPVIKTPGTGSIVRSTLPEVIGTAEAGSLVQLKVNDRAVGETIVDSTGVVTIVPSKTLTEGEQVLQLVSTARGLMSASASQKITIDTKAPEIDIEKSFALLSLSGPDTYDVQVATTPDATIAHCQCGAISTALQSSQAQYLGTIVLDPRKTTSGILRIAVSDSAGNETSVALADTTLFTTGVVASSGNRLVTAFQAIAFSRAVMVMFLVALLVIALMNIFIQLERQHHATIIGTMLVMYLAGSLILL
jgi:uncharacterized protein YkwD